MSLLLTGCDDDRVTVRYDPEPGTTTRYSLEIESTVTRTIEGSVAEVVTDDAVLDEEVTVLDRPDDGGAVVEVVLRRPGTADRTYRVLLDRAGQLTEIEEAEGLPVESLGDAVLSGATSLGVGVTPDRPVRPGDEWTGTTDDAIVVSGRLGGLGIVDGADVARVETVVTLPLRERSVTREGSATISGDLVSTIEATHDLADGVLRSGTAVTRGRFALVLGAPPDLDAAPIAGSLEVEIRTRRTRVD